MPEKALLVAVVSAKERPSDLTAVDDTERGRAGEALVELAELVDSTGREVAGTFIQVREEPDYRFYLGKGKINELAAYVEELGPDIIVCDDELTPLQQRNLEEAIGLPVMDRTSIILEIFAKRALSREGKLQVELARLRYWLPRLTGKGTELSRLGGGIGTRGPGEKKLERERRHLRRRIRRLERNIEEIRKHRQLLRQQRVRNRMPVVALVGYTNAGKSSLLKALTGDTKAYVDPRVFATLDPEARMFKLPGGREVLVVDTVGFIRKLPHQLVAAFQATLEEINYADLLLHVVDAASPDFENHIEVAGEVLKEIGAEEQPVILVFNKVDLLDEEKLNRLKASYHQAVFISALTGQGLDELKKQIEMRFFQEGDEATVVIPYEKMDVLHRLRRQVFVLEEVVLDRGIRVRVRGDTSTLQRYKMFLEGESLR